MSAKKQNNIEEIISKTAEELLKQLEVEATVSVQNDEEEGYKLNIETPETGLLIGYHGEVVNSIQVLLGIMVYKKSNEWVRIVVDVGDYRQKREESIKRIAEEKAEEVITTGQSVALPYLSPLERRIVHITLAENPKVYSESEGEGKDRHIVIKLRES